MTVNDFSEARVWFDVSDLVLYLSKHSAVSGVQRVVTETLRSLEEGGADVRPCVACPDRHSFVDVPSLAVHALLNEQVHSTPDRGDPDPRVSTTTPTVRRQAKQIIKAARKAALVDFRHGDVVCSLGATWSNPVSYRAIDDARQLGAQTFFLIYDVIPLIGDHVPESARDVFRPHIEFVRTRADRIAFISESARRDFLTALPGFGTDSDVVGSATGLPPGLSPSSTVAELAEPERIWTNPFVLMVGTIEERKDHITVLNAWRELLRTHPDQEVPDLLCAGRLSWGSTAFVRELLEDPELAEKIHIPEGPVSDTDLYRLYRDCEFTIFASRAEGWGLPITESLAFGKPVVAASGSSLPEAGGESAVYFEPGDHMELAAIVAQLSTDSAYFEFVASRIELRDLPTWADVTVDLRREIGIAHGASASRPRTGPPILTTGVEYPLYLPLPFYGPDEGSNFKRFADAHRRLPLTHQYADVSASLVGYLSFRAIGKLHPSEPECHGPTMADGSGIRLRFQPPRAGMYLLLLSMVRAEDGGSSSIEIKGGKRLGSSVPESVLPIILDSTSGSDPIEVVLSVADSPSARIRISLETVILLAYEDEGSRNSALQSVREMAALSKADTEALLENIERRQRRFASITSRPQQTPRRRDSFALVRRIQRRPQKPEKNTGGWKSSDDRAVKRRVAAPFPAAKEADADDSLSIDQALLELDSQRVRSSALQRDLSQLNQEIRTQELKGKRF